MPSSAHVSSAGGAAFLVKGFGDSVLVSGINLFMWVGYIISLALANGLRQLRATFVTRTPSALLLKSLAVAVVVLLTVVMPSGAAHGPPETVIVMTRWRSLCVCGGGCLVHPTRLPLAGIVARNPVGPVRGGRAVHRLRGFAGDQCRSRHARSGRCAAGTLTSVIIVIAIYLRSHDRRQLVGFEIEQARD
jgi:hypothetical protein